MLFFVFFCFVFPRDVTLILSCSFSFLTLGGRSVGCFSVFFVYWMYPRRGSEKLGATMYDIRCPCHHTARVPVPDISEDAGPKGKCDASPIMSMISHYRLISLKPSPRSQGTVCCTGWKKRLDGRKNNKNNTCTAVLHQYQFIRKGTVLPSYCSCGTAVKRWRSFTPVAQRW